MLHVCLLILIFVMQHPEIFSFADIDNLQLSYAEEDQAKWGEKWPRCNGKLQSPIAIYKHQAKVLELPAIEMIGYRNTIRGEFWSYNDGHAVLRRFPKNSRTPYIFTGYRSQKYEIEEFHFHWGAKNNRGSEHMINDVRYPMEMHLVHRNTKYRSVIEALKHPDGFKILSFFFQVKETSSKSLRKYAENLEFISKANSSVWDIDPFQISSLLGNVDLDHFYVYRGSFTTPPCSESVTWYLFPDTLPITTYELSLFRNITGNFGAPIADNYRLLQNKNNRKILFRDFQTDVTSKLNLLFPSSTERKEKMNT